MKARVGFAVDSAGVATEVTQVFGAARSLTSTEFRKAWDRIDFDYSKIRADIHAALAQFK